MPKGILRAGDTVKFMQGPVLHDKQGLHGLSKCSFYHRLVSYISVETDHSCIILYILQSEIVRKLYMFFIFFFIKAHKILFAIYILNGK